LNNPGEIAIPRASGIIWRIVIGILALFLLAGGGAWLMYAGIDPSQEARAAQESQGEAAPRPATR
jgi:hypothetical protein